jgi:hypothetical protein
MEDRKIYILHENDEWTRPLKNRLDELGFPYEDWFLDNGMVDLTEKPPRGIFYNRMSASSHTREHRYGPELTDSVISWLERHEREVINGGRAIELEVSKVKQYMALDQHGIQTPKTIATVGKEKMIKAAESFDGDSFITKHNRAGKGLGVRLFHSVEALAEYIDGPEFEPSVDGITLIQQYIQAPEPYITRCEFIGGEFFYAVQVDTSEGFELCPADACRIDDLACPAGEQSTAANRGSGQPKFQIIDGFTHPVIEKYEAFLAANDIQVAGIEFIRNGHDGDIYTYDVNTNTNYNSEAENKAGQHGMLELAKYLGSKLEVGSPVS